MTQSKTVTSEACDTTATEAKEDTVPVGMDYEDFPPPPPEDLDDLPPPPPDLLQMPLDSEDVPPCHDVPVEPPEAVNAPTLPVSREVYLKQRRTNELKRLYKHINPKVLKQIEEDSDNDEVENNHVDGCEHPYEDDSPDDVNNEEGVEWEEILPGDVQAMRWMFENKPLDIIQDVADSEDEENNRISQQEMILGKDVKRTAWMFETKPMDKLSTHVNSTEYKNKFNKLDKGDVRAAAWLFETQAMDTLNRMHKEEDLTKEIVFTEEDGNATIYMIDNKHMESLGHTETIDESHLLILRSVLEEINGEVKTITSTFDTQFKCIIMGQSSQMLEIKSVRKIESELEHSIASRWLFDTQPLDLTNGEATPLKLVCSLSMEDSNKGDWGRWLFEIKTLNSPSEWGNSKLENQEVVGADVRKHCLVFETQPMDSLKDDANARPQTIEDIIGGNVRSARNFFESSPRIERKANAEVGKLLKAAVNGETKGDVRHQRWRFESQPLEHIREEKKEVTRTVNVEEDLTQEDGTSCRADVRKNCWVFETQPMDTLKDDSNSLPASKEQIIAGNVRSARHYFETIPAEELKELAEVGKLKKTVALDEEKGDVRHQKWRFESQPLEQISEEKKSVIRTIDQEEIDKVDVQNFKHLFESSELNRNDESHRILIEGVTSGSVKSNKDLFESSQLYAMQDQLGHLHEVKTVRREEVVKGDVTTCKWMFETRPVDQFNESIETYQIIKGISKQEIESGDVKTAKWLFETQPLDGIKYFSNIEDEEVVGTSTNIDIVKGDVKTCKWLFETKPMDVLYEKVEADGKNDGTEMQKGDVKTCTWLFETQALDAIRNETETVLKACTVNEEEIRGKDVKTACFLFETEKLEDLTGEEEDSFKRVTEIDIASGDVSRMKYIFENQTCDIMTSTSEEEMQKLKRVRIEELQKGNVVNCKWLFENQTIHMIHDSSVEIMSGRTVNDVQGGDVNKGRFIFETCSLDEIKEDSSEEELRKMQKILREEDEKGDVRNYTMMFENQPLYAIQDKAGLYHEVTTVTSEEVTRGDVVGTRWLFETKPLDTIKDTDDVHIIRSVTQQDVQKGDVTSAKWKFETQPLDRIAEEKKTIIRTVGDIQGGNVRINKDRFETDALSQECVRTVNVSEIQKGDVRSAKWRFETQSIDKIRSMSSENLIETVKEEEIAKGDVKHSVWLFEKNPLDHIKEVDEDVDCRTTAEEEVSSADVKTTTWLFETTPFDNFNETKTERTEIMGKSVKETLEELYSQQMVRSKGILIESDEIGDIRMAKYQLMNKQAPEIQREEVIRGDLQTIMMNLLNTEEREKQCIVVDSEEKGNISSTVQQLFNQEKGSSVEREAVVQGDIQEALNNLFSKDQLARHGILIQEDEKGDVQMTIYSLLNQEENVNVEKGEIVRGDIKAALQKLSSKSDQVAKIQVDVTEKGNVNFYSTCIESGSLDYLKQLHLEPDEAAQHTAEKEKIIGGDIKATKRVLGCNQSEIGRTVEDVIPGDVHNAVKVFMSEPTFSLDGLQKEEIVKGDLRAALNSLTELANHAVVVEKEEVVKGNIPKALRCLERAQKHYKETEKPDIIPGNIKGAMRSLEKSSTSKSEAVVEDLVPGDVKATVKSLELAKEVVREVEKEEIVRGDIRVAMRSLRDASSERRISQSGADTQGDVRGTIQLLMEAPSSPKLQRRPSLEEELKGDVKMSIKSLYDTQEQIQLEKEEVIKGDVKGTIKSLLETAQRETPKVKLRAYRRVKVKQNPPVKNLTDAQRNVEKIKTALVVEASNKSVSSSNETETVRTKSSSVEHSAQEATTVLEHKTITQNHGIKTLKTEFRNLKASPKGMIKVSKTKVQTDIYNLKPAKSEPDLPLPPPPPPVEDIDLLPPPPPPPPPPSLDSEIDHLPPPPPPAPVFGEQDFLPPPPSQQELEVMPTQAAHPSPTIAKKMTVKKIKGPALHPVPKLEPHVELSQTKQKVEVVSERKVEVSQKQTKTASKTVSCEFPPPPASPQPPRKVYTPVRFTPPPSPTPPARGPSSKFNTPLIKAEEKYRKMKEANTPPATPTPTLVHDYVTAAVESLTTTDGNNALGVMTAEKKVANVHSDFRSCDSSQNVTVAASNVSASQEKIVTGSTITSSAKQQIVSNETSKIVSVQQTSSVSAVRQQIHSTTQKTVSVSSQQQVAQSVTAENVQNSATDTAKTEERKKKHPKIKVSSKYEDKRQDETRAEKIPVKLGEDEPVATAEKKVKPVVKSENIPSDQTPPTVTSDKITKEPKPEQQANCRATDHSAATSKSSIPDQHMQAEKASANRNGKTAKTNHKGKKNNNKQEKQVEIKVSAESEKQIVTQDVKVEVKEVKESAEVTVISKSKEVKSELVQEMKSADFPCMPAAIAGIADSPPETSAPSKKKKRSKKSKGGTQTAQGKDASTESKTESPTQGTTTVGQNHKSLKEEHVQTHKEVIIEGDHTSLQQEVVEKHVMGSQKEKGVTDIQQGEQKTLEERIVPITVTGGSGQNETLRSVTRTEEESHRQDVRELKSTGNIPEAPEVFELTHPQSEKTTLSMSKNAIVSLEEKHEAQVSVVETVQKHSEIRSHKVVNLEESVSVQIENKETMEKHEREVVSEKSLASGAMPRISKISIGSAKVESQTQKKSSHEKRREDLGLSKTLDLRAPSPLLRMRSPSPTFITIESIRRTDSPHRVTPSPTLLHRPATPPTPPPRRCDTPSRLTRITPSPTFDRAENLPRLKDATAKLSRGVTPPPLLLHQQISEKKAGIVELPASFHRQIRIDSHLLDTSSGVSLAREESEKSFSGEAVVDSAHVEISQACVSERLNADGIESKSESENDPVLAEDEDVSEPSAATFKEKRYFFEEAQRAEKNKTHTRKEPIAIPERLGPETSESKSESTAKEKDEVSTAAVSSIVNIFQSSEERSSSSKELISFADWLDNSAGGTDTDKEIADFLEGKMPTFDIQTIKSVFEVDEQVPSLGEAEKVQEEPASRMAEGTEDDSEQKVSQETKINSQTSTPRPPSTKSTDIAPAEPKPAFSETKSVTEHFSHVDEFGKKTDGTMTTVTEHSESTSTQQVPFSYADAVKRKAARRTTTYDDDATETLLRNFHQTWSETETVFKSLGFTVSEETTSQVVSHQSKTLSSGKQL